MPTFNVNTVDWDELYDGKASYAPETPVGISAGSNLLWLLWNAEGSSRDPCSIPDAAPDLFHWHWRKGDMNCRAGSVWSAIEQATQAAARRGLTATFAVADLSRSTGYERYFNTVIVASCSTVYLKDSGPVPPIYRRRARPGGKFFALVFGDPIVPT